MNNPLHWFQVPAEVVCEGEQLEFAYVYVRTDTSRNALVKARQHVHDTWGTADQRIDYRVEVWTPVRLKRETEQEQRAFLNRPEDVFSSKEAISS